MLVLPLPGPNFQGNKWGPLQVADYIPVTVEKLKTELILALVLKYTVNWEKYDNYPFPKDLHAVGTLERLKILCVLNSVFF